MRADKSKRTSGVECPLNRFKLSLELLKAVEQGGRCRLQAVQGAPSQQGIQIQGPAGRMRIGSPQLVRLVANVFTVLAADGADAARGPLLVALDLAQPAWLARGLSPVRRLVVHGWASARSPQAVA